MLHCIFKKVGKALGCYQTAPLLGRPSYLQRMDWSISQYNANSALPANSASISQYNANSALPANSASISQYNAHNLLKEVAMTKELPITPENIERVLLNSGFELALDGCYFNRLMDLLCKVKNGDYEFYSDWSTKINEIKYKYPDTMTNDLDAFLVTLQKHITLTPPAEDPLGRWWNENKVEGFKITQSGIGINGVYILRKVTRLLCSEVKTDIANIYIEVSSLTQIKRSILALLEIYKD